MDGSLQFFPNGLVDHLLALDGSFRPKEGRDDGNGNVRTIRIVKGACVCGVVVVVVVVVESV